MRTYTELHLAFLSGILESLPQDKKVLADPEGFITWLKTQFTQALDAYNIWTWNKLWKEICIEKELASLSLEQKVAQLFVVWFEWTELDVATQSSLRTYAPGWVILMWRNIGSGLLDLTTSLQSLMGDIPFLVSIDQEWWPVVRIPEDLPGQATASFDEICPTYLARSELLKKYGINLNFGIVADTTTAAWSFIYPRVFRDNISEKVTEAVTCTTETLSTLKHFPGHGMTSQDTHIWVAWVDISEKNWTSTHLPPFVAGIQAWADVVMMAHIIMPWLDDVYPASLSIHAVQLVRNQWFSWLVITDDLGMLRGDYTEKEAIKQALLAGNDLLLLVNPVDIETTITYATQLVRNWLITESDLHSRLERILRAKQKVIELWRWVPRELLDERNE